MSVNELYCKVILCPLQQVEVNKASERMWQFFFKHLKKVNYFQEMQSMLLGMSHTQTQILMKLNRYYQNMKCFKSRTSLEELNIFNSYVSYETSTEQCKLGIRVIISWGSDTCPSAFT